MTEEFTIGDRLTSTMVALRGLSEQPIGTGHLLYAVAHDKEVAPLLDAFDITARVVLAVQQTPGRIAAEPDAASLADPEATWPAGSLDDHARARDTDGRVHRLSAAAATALRDGAGDSCLTLLAAMLDGPGSEAFAVIRECGVDPAEVRHSATDQEIPQRPDRLAPELRPARDALLGRVRYRGRGLRDLLLFSVLARQANHARHPVLWARLEADERARAQRRATRTDDVLLALLVTHEVAATYPHMIGSAKDNYGGGEALLAQGVDHQRVRAVTLDDRPDEVPAGAILRPGPNWTEDTRTLLARLTEHPGNRATRLLDTLT